MEVKTPVWLYGGCDYQVSTDLNKCRPAAVRPLLTGRLAHRGEGYERELRVHGGDVVEGEGYTVI